jgi:dihydroorotase
MVHLGPAPATVKEILDTLGAGDILTHCYTGWAGNSLVEDGKPKAFVLEAIKRGVIFDVGHGAGGFDSTVAEIMITAGYLPSAISTDIHTGSIAKVHNLPSVMSKFLALGMSLEDIVYRSSYAPQSIGGFAFSKESQYPIGGLASFAVFEVEEGEFEFADAHGHTFSGQQRILPVLVVSAGQIVVDTKNMRGE